MRALETLLLERRDGVAVLTLNRPDCLNALNKQLIDDLVTCLLEVGADPMVKCVVLKGAGRAFCAGADLVRLPDEIDVTSRAAVYGYLRQAGRIVTLMTEMAKPVIAQVHGHAVGGGCNLALAADLVVAAEDAVFGQVYVKRGIVPDLGGMYFLPRIVGLAKAKELLLLGDEISAGEAERIGFVSRVVPLDRLESTVMALVGRLAQSSAQALALTKAGINAGLRGGLADVLEFEASAEAAVFQSDFVRDALRAFGERGRLGRR